MNSSIFGEAFFGVMNLRWRKITGKIKRDNNDTHSSGTYYQRRPVFYRIGAH
jgi:hypothetical protein